MGLLGLGSGSAGALDVGSVKATLAYDHDTRNLRAWDRAVDGARRDARHPIEQKLRGDYDRRGFDLYDRASDKAHRQTSLLTRTAGLGGRGLLALGRGAVVAGGVLGGAFILGTKKAVEASSDLNESLNASEAIFESQGKTIAKWSEGTADAFGLARSESLQGAASIGAMLKPMGFAIDKASDMSMKMVELAGDMASFNNQDPSEMLERIRSGLAGESEPLRQFGVDLRLTAVESFALKEGLIESGEKLEGQQQVWAMYQKILSDTKDQQGDFGRTSEGMANAQRRLRANVIDLGAAYGSAFRPLVQGAIGDLNDFVVQMKEGVGEGGRFADFLVGVGHDVEDFAGKIEHVLTNENLRPGEKAERIFGMFMDVAGDAIEAGVPKIADAVAHAAPQVAGRFVKAFISADSWGRLALGAFLLTKLGGAGALRGTGGKLGGGLTEGILGGVLGSGAAGGAAKGGLSSRLGSLLAAAGPVAKRLGVIGLGLTIGDTVLSSIDRRIREGSDDIGEALGAMTEDVKIGPVGIDVNALGIEASTTQAEDLENLYKSMLTTRTQMTIVSERERQEMAESVDLSEKAAAVRDRIFQLLKKGRKLGVGVDLSMDPKALNEIETDMRRLRNGVFTDGADIEKTAQRVNRTIVDQFGAGTKEARHLTAQNMRATAQAFAASMRESGDYTDAGMRRIKRLIRQADLMEGLHPAEFGRQFANVFGRAEDVTKRSIGHILDELDKMPKGARASAWEAMQGQLRELRRGGKLSRDEVRDIRSAILSEFGGLKTDAVGSTFDLTKGVLMNFGGLGNGIAAALTVIQENTNQGLSAFNVSPVKWIVKTIGNLIQGGQKKARGGFLEGPSRGDVVPVLAGRDEAFVTSWQQQPINAALQFAAAHGVQPYPHLGALFANERRPHAGGPPVDRKAQGGFPGVQVVNGASSEKNKEAGSVNVALATMERLAQMHIPYVWGGGHGSWDPTPAGLDCSGAVSLVLHEAGLLSQPMVSGALESWGAPGAGAITVYANPSHAWMEVNGRPWGTSVNDSSHGLGFYGEPSASYKAGFTARHAAGAVMTELARVMIEGPEGPFKDMAQHAVDRVWKGADKYLKAKMPGGFGGGDANVAAIRGGKVVGASTYHPDAFTGTVGAAGKSLVGTMSFAELGMGHNLGGLPFGAKLKVGYGDRAVVAEKLDIGLGGGDVQGHRRDIDLWYETANALGLPSNWLGLVKVAPASRGGFAGMQSGGWPGAGGSGGGNIPSQILKLYSKLTNTKKAGDRDKILDEIKHLEKRLQRRRKKKRQAHFKGIRKRGKMPGFEGQIEDQQKHVTHLEEQIGGLEEIHGLTEPREVEKILRDLGLDPEADLTKLTDEQKQQVRNAINADYETEEAETRAEVDYNERELRALLTLRKTLLAAIDEGERRIRIAERKAKKAEEEQDRLQKLAREAEREIEKLQDELQDLGRGKAPKRQKGESKEAHEKKVKEWEGNRDGARDKIEGELRKARFRVRDFKERAQGWGTIAKAHRADVSDLSSFVGDEVRPTLEDVQGVDRTMDPDVKVAPLGVGVPQFGGQILDSQSKLAELGASEWVRPDPFKTGEGAAGGETERLAEEKLQLTEAELARYKRNEAVMAAQSPIFAAAEGFPRLLSRGGFSLEGMVAPFVGSYRVGTPNISRDGYAYVHRNEEIVSPERSGASGGGGGGGDVFVALTGDLAWLSPYVQAHIVDELDARGEKATAAGRRPAAGVLARKVS